MAHIVFQKLLKFLRLLLCCTFLLVCYVLLFPRQAEIHYFVPIHNKWLVCGVLFTLGELHHWELVYISTWIISRWVWGFTRLDNFLIHLWYLVIATVREFWEQMFIKMAFLSQPSNRKQCNVVFCVFLFDESWLRVNFSENTFTCLRHVENRVVKFNTIASVFFTDVVRLQLEVLRWWLWFRTSWNRRFATDNFL